MDPFMPADKSSLYDHLHDYQIYAKNFILQHPFCGLFFRMGLGKTSIVLEALYELNPTGHVLVVAPKTIARCTWEDEIRKWKMPLRTASFIVNEKGKDLGKKKREEMYASVVGAPTTMWFINRELLVNIISWFENNRLPWPFTTMIIDESQSFKSYKSERFKAFKKIRPYVQRLVLLTGSPTPNGLMDLWSQIWLLDQGARLGKTITAYRNEFFRPGLIVNNYPVTWNPIKGARHEIYRRISDIVISMQNNRIKLPPLIFNNAEVIMNDDEMARYKKFVATAVLDLKNGDQIEAPNAAVLTGKLSQMASGAIYTSTGSKEFEKVHDHKTDMACYIINNTDSPVIVAYNFKSDIAMLMEKFAKEKISASVFDGTPKMVQDWNNRKIPVLLLQPASGGFGLNLQKGGHTLIWYTLPWNFEHYEQTNARVFRQGQEEPVIIHHIMTRGTIDSHILSALQKKDTSQKALIAAVEATISDAGA